MHFDTLKNLPHLTKLTYGMSRTRFRLDFYSDSFLIIGPFPAGTQVLEETKKDR